ncbi:serine/threonine-protein kinase [Streptomyces olivaceus]|uniref:serine/threonine-protein kinase n=1 Tax=Streptomyces olivaceus TaxID=47716 RepID=UPI0033DE31E9
MRGLGNGEPRQVGRYRLLGRLGAGGMGDVYLARSDRGRTVAIKLVREEMAAQEEFRARFRYEVEAARRVGGHWTAPVLDADTEAAVPWVATSYVAGPSLRQIVGRDHGPLPEHSVRTLAAGLAHALQDIHGAGIVHRDLKPSNVLVTIDGPRVIDFGIARALETVTDGRLTRTGALVGSPGFMAPEQVRSDRITPASDIFCLGLVLIFAATGRMAFGSTRTGAHVLMYRIAHEEPDLEGFPAGGVDLIRHCLEKDPAARPSLDEILWRTGAQDSVADGRSKEPWLPGPLVARLSQHAVSFPDTEVVQTSACPATGVATPPSAPASSRMSRRSVLTALTFAGAASGSGAFFWLRSRSTQDSAREKQVFELPNGEQKIDAIMPVPVSDDPNPSSRYWIFAGDRYLLIRASVSGHPVEKILAGPAELSRWGSTIGNVEGFRKKIVAVMRVPGKPGQYWVFSQDQYMRIEVSPEGSGSALKSSPAPIGDWKDTFGGFSRIDSVMPVPDDPYQVWAFSGSDYVRTRLHSEGNPGGQCQLKNSIGGGWRELSRRFSSGIDAVMPSPNEPYEYWVFSGSRYLKMKVPGKSYKEEVLQEPTSLLGPMSARAVQDVPADGPRAAGNADRRCFSGQQNQHITAAQRVLPRGFNDTAGSDGAGSGAPS